jgi:hypothetical protein
MRSGWYTRLALGAVALLLGCQPAGGAAGSGWLGRGGGAEPAALAVPLAGDAAVRVMAPAELPLLLAEPMPSSPAQRPPGYRALDAPQTAYARRGGAYVRVAPLADAEMISQLFFDTPLPLLGAVDEGGSAAWYEVEVWGVLRGWIRAAEVAVEQEPDPVAPPWERGITLPPLTLAGPKGPAPLATSGRTTREARMRTAPTIDAPVVAEVPPGRAGRVTAWATDEDAEAWFEVALDEGAGWIFGANWTLDRPAGMGSAAVAARLAGTGMWVSRPFVPLANPAHLVRAAQALGLTHLYVDVASSRGGFYSRDAVAALLPVAHAAGIRVLGWVWPTLADPLADVALSVELARYVTPDGHRLDGLAPNMEERMNVEQVRAYMQVLRTHLGPDYPLVGTVFPPEHSFARRHPQHLVLAGWVDLLAPMAYWSEARRAFSGDEVYRYVARAVDQLRVGAGDPAYPVAPIGQMYDTFGRNGIGAYSPGTAEIRAALQASKDAGALGASFFQWGTATPEEWRALRDFAW